MRRSEKIDRYLREHRDATPKRLQKKFRLSYGEAVELHSRFHGLEGKKDRTPSRLFGRVSGFVSRLFSTEKNTLIGLVSLAALVRIVYALFLFRHEALRLPILDAEYYVGWARQILDTGWLGDRVFFTEPFYAYFLAVFIKIFGSVAETAVMAVQWCIGSTLPVVVYFLARRLFNGRVAVVAAILTALYGPFVFYEGLLLKTGLEVWILPLFASYLLSVFFRADRRQYLILGLLLGVTVLIKGNNLVYWPLLSIAMLMLLPSVARKERFFLIGLFTLGVFVFIVPVTVRNTVVGHDFVPTNYSIGLVLYQGNWYAGDGTTALVPPFLRPHPKYEETDAVGMAEAFSGRALKPSEVSRFWIGKAISETIADPGHFVRTLGNKALLLVNRGEVSDNYSYDHYAREIPFLRVLPGAWLVLVLGLAGIVRSVLPKKDEDFVRDQAEDCDAPRRRKALLSILMGGYVLVLVGTNINSRYRLPMFPFLMPFSAATMVLLWDLYREHAFRRMVPVCVGIVVFLGVTAFPFPIFKAVGEANALFTIGDGYLESGNEAKASEYFEAAKAADEKYAWAYSNLFLIALKQGDRERAFENLKHLIQIRPDDLSNFDKLKLYKESESVSDVDLKAFVEEGQRKLDEHPYDPWAYEAGRYLDRKDTPSAKSELEASLEHMGNSSGTLFQLAVVSRDDDDKTMTTQYYRKALALNPWLFPARYNLANIAITNNDYPEVVRQLKDVYETTPELGETWYNYAIALIKTGKNQEAAVVASEYVERYKDDSTKKDKVEKFRAALKPNPAADLLKQAK
jgi:tetratricopeptide (TPR) repeat protein/4-amino-4-deoxy-L-arabinose transferase-like glycosyltransferase